MSVVRSFLLGLGGAAVVASGVAGPTSTASAQTVAAGVGACEHYARQYAAVNTPQFGDWNTAYRFAYNECVTGGPDFVVGGPYSYGGGPLAAGAHVSGSALHAGANIAGSALHAGASVAGTALSIPGAILGGTASAFAPATAPVQPRISPTAAPVVTKNYRGTYETAPVTAGAGLE